MNGHEINWDRLERGDYREAAPSEGLALLQRAVDAELRFEVDEAKSWLARARSALGPQAANAIDLVALRIAARGGTEISMLDALAGVDSLLGGELDLPTRGRAELLRGTLLARLNRLDEAELALSGAIHAIGDAPARAWALDAFASVLTGQGAFEEARRLFRHVIAAKVALGDGLGEAISAGNLARLELRGGSPPAACELLGATLARLGSRLEPLSLLRLETAWVETALDSGVADELEAALAALEQRLLALRDVRHYLVGFGEITLARASRDEADETLQRASRSMSLPVHRALLAFWREELFGDAGNIDGWFPAFRQGLEAAGPNTEAEVRGHLLVARRARLAADRARCAEALDAATRCARAGNNALWMSWVDEEATLFDPRVAAERVLERYSGVSVEGLRSTRRVEATILFADLVGFTARSNDLEPEAVMSTVRGLFEAASPVLAKHRVRPLAYLGDGLLAIAEGDRHEERGAGCALALVRRTDRLSEARRAAGEPFGLELRAGVASGSIVVGPLGNQLKLDFTAIGMPVNLAARLQAAAEPGQVVIERKTAVAAGLAVAEVEALSLKGIAQKTDAVRLVAKGT